MKYLSSYTEAAITKLFDELGAFFAFSNEQFDEAKNPKVKKYVSLGAGLVCPKENVDEFQEQYNNLIQEGIRQDLAENDKIGIIHRELGNYEYCVTYDISDTVAALQQYGITPEEIQAEVKPYLKAYYEWEAKN